MSQVFEVFNSASSKSDKNKHLLIGNDLLGSAFLSPLIESAFGL